MDDKEIIKLIEKWVYDTPDDAGTGPFSDGYREGLIRCRRIIKTILEYRQELPTEGDSQD